MADREGRLDALREEAARTGRVGAAGAGVEGAPFPAAEGGYYGRPLLKPPVWTWEIPLYFFVGGIAGVAAAIGAVAALSGAAGTLARDAHAIAAAGALISPLLLISDLGRPARFLNMLRVFKRQSPMSVGAWTLVLFGPAALGALAFELLAPADSVLAGALAIAVNLIAALLGVLLATYTGVLLGVSAIPIWWRHAAVLPWHFAASSLGAAAGSLELVGHRDPALHLLALGAAIAETGIAATLYLRGAPAMGVAIRLGELGSGLLPLLLRTVFSGLPGARPAAAMAAIGGALLTRVGWIRAGREDVR
jgi:hypothetical protein